MVWQVTRVVGLTLSASLLAFELFYAYISRSDAYSPGANDNASGVGVVLTLARHFCEHPPDHLDMQYVLFTWCFMFCYHPWLYGVFFISIKPGFLLFSEAGVSG